MKLVRLTRKSGTRWKALVLKTQGGYVSKTFSTKGLARAWGLRTEREIEERVAKGDRAMPTITVGELVTGWASERIPLSQSYRLHSEFILPRMGSLVAAELTTKDVRSLLADYQARGVSNTSVNRLKSCLSSILSRGVRLELIEENICRRIPALAHKTPKARTLTRSEADQLLRVCRDSKWDKLYLLVLMALTTAGRKGELLGLTWERIDLSARTALVVETRNGDDRVLSLTEPVVAELRRFHEDDGLVFPSPWIPDQAFTFRPVWLDALRDAGLSGPAGVRLRFHELRHSCLTWLAEYGCELQRIALVGGHRSIQTSMLYIHLNTDSKRRVVDEHLGNVGG